MQRWVKILLHTDDMLVLETINLLDTLCFVSSTNRWSLDEIIPDDIHTCGRVIENNILYYKRK